MCLISGEQSFSNHVSSEIFVPHALNCFQASFFSFFAWTFFDLVCKKSEICLSFKDWGNPMHRKLTHNGLCVGVSL